MAISLALKFLVSLNTALVYLLSVLALARNLIRMKISHVYYYFNMLV